VSNVKNCYQISTMTTALCSIHYTINTHINVQIRFDGSVLYVA